MNHALGLLTDKIPKGVDSAAGDISCTWLVAKDCQAERTTVVRGVRLATA